MPHAPESMKDRTPAPLVELRVTTRHPQDYVLLNKEDGSRWHGTPDGKWKRIDPDDEDDEARQMYLLRGTCDRLSLRNAHLEGRAQRMQRRIEELEKEITGGSNGAGRADSRVALPDGST